MTKIKQGQVLQMDDLCFQWCGQSLSEEVTLKWKPEWKAATMQNLWHGPPRQWQQHEGPNRPFYLKGSKAGDSEEQKKG